MPGMSFVLLLRQDQGPGKDLVLVSFQKSFLKDIVPATIASCIKQTVLLCYQLSDEEAQNLHQVRAHDVRAFAASKAFCWGSPWTSFSQLAIGRPIICLLSFI